MSGIAAAGALWFLGTQTRRLRRADEELKQREIDGVAVSWASIESPDGPRDAGTARWLYEFRIDNPGRLPVDEIEARVQLAVPVRRVRHSGRVEPAATSITLRAPVIPAYGHGSWERRLELDFDARDSLEETRAVVSFTSADGTTHTNSWPRKRT